MQFTHSTLGSLPVLLTRAEQAKNVDHAGLVVRPKIVHFLHLVYKI